MLQARLAIRAGATCLLAALLTALVAAESGLVRADSGGGADAAYDRDVAALARALEAEPGNAALAVQVAARLEAVRADPAAARARVRAQLAAQRLVPLRVPGLFWQRHPETGAALDGVETWLGAPVARIETDEVGTVEANAERVAEAVRADTKDGVRAVVISASKGSADVRAALESEPKLGERVAIWIDLVGILEGTPLTGGGFGPLATANGLPPATARSMSTSVRAAAARPDRFPGATRAVHVAAFPAAADVSKRARPSFAWLRGLGPNDGYVLLDAHRRAPGRVLVLRGTDHYLAGTPDLGERMLALLAVLLQEGCAPSIGSVAVRTRGGGGGGARCADGG